MSYNIKDGIPESGLPLKTPSGRAEPRYVEDGKSFRAPAGSWATGDDIAVIHGRIAGVDGDVEQLGDRVSNLEAGQSAGQKVYRTWSELSAVTGSAGEGAQVIDDTGTHTDPVVGGTVSNAGQYVWSESPAGWRWVRPDALALKADKDDLAVVEQRVSEVDSTKYSLSGWLSGQWSAAGVRGWGLHRIKGFCIGHVEDVAGKLSSLLARVPALESKIGYDNGRSPWLFKIKGPNGRIGFGLRTDGHMVYRGVDVDAALLGGAGAGLVPRKDIAMWGDSLTQGSGTGTTGLNIGAQLKALFSAEGDFRDVQTFGLAGQSSEKILARQGAVPVRLTFPVGPSGFNEIPADTDPVEVLPSIAFLSHPDPSRTNTITGSVVQEGVSIHGVVTKVGTTGEYTFVRTSAGAAVKVGPEVEFRPDTMAMRNWTLVCWIGTNDILTKSPEQIVGYMERYASWQASVVKRCVFVMPAINCLSASVATIKANYASILMLARAKFPYAVIDTLGLLQRNGDGSEDDNNDIAAGLPPRSLLAEDRYHLNVAGYGVVAAAVKSMLERMEADD